MALRSSRTAFLTSATRFRSMGMVIFGSHTIAFTGLGARAQRCGSGAELTR